MNIAVVGAYGFVGKEICSAFERIGFVGLTKIKRGDSLSILSENFDVVIHCANSPSRYKAKSNPHADYEESVIKTFEILSHINEKSLFVLVSSISARTQLDHFYGINRLSCENLLAGYNSLVIRLGYMFKLGYCYGVIDDLINNRDIYVSSQSTYSFSDINWVGDVICRLSLERRNGLIELGSNDIYDLSYLKSYLGSSSSFKGDYLDDQIPDDSLGFYDTQSRFLEYLKVSS